MMRGAARRLRTVWRLRRWFRNWPEILLLSLAGRCPKRLRLRNGLVIAAPARNTLVEMAEEIFVREVYTPPGFTIGAEDVVVDIGANVGMFSLFAAGRTRRSVYAFEPCPENLTFLRANIRANRCTNVTVSGIAVADHDGTARLYLSDISAGHLLFDRNVHGRLDRHVEVPTRTLPRAAQEHAIGRIDFLKLDCEGSEGAILKSLPPAFLEKIGRIAMEFHDNVCALHHEDMQRLLEESGFACRLVWDGKSPFGYLFAARKPE